MIKSKCQMKDGDRLNIKSIEYIHLAFGFDIGIRMPRTHTQLRHPGACLLHHQVYTIKVTLGCEIVLVCVV